MIAWTAQVIKKKLDLALNNRTGGQSMGES